MDGTWGFVDVDTHTHTHTHTGDKNEIGGAWGDAVTD